MVWAIELERFQDSTHATHTMPFQLPYVSNACHSLSGVADRLHHTMPFIPVLQAALALMLNLY